MRLARVSMCIVLLYMVCHLPKLLPTLLELIYQDPEVGCKVWKLESWPFFSRKFLISSKSPIYCWQSTVASTSPFTSSPAEPVSAPSWQSGKDRRQVQITGEGGGSAAPPLFAANLRLHSWYFFPNKNIQLITVSWDVVFQSQPSSYSSWEKAQCSCRDNIQLQHTSDSRWDIQN